MKAENGTFEWPQPWLGHNRAYNIEHRSQQLLLSHDQRIFPFQVLIVIVENETVLYNTFKKKIYIHSMTINIKKQAN